MVSHWGLGDSKSPQVSETLLSILTDLSKAVVWMVSTRPFISKSSSPCANPFVTIRSAPITIGIIVTFMSHSFFNSLARLRYICLFSHSFNFPLWSTSTAKSTILQVLSCCCWLLSDLVDWPRFGDPFAPQNPRGVYAPNSSRTLLLLLLLLLFESFSHRRLLMVLHRTLLESPGLFSVFCPILIML